MRFVTNIRRLIREERASVAVLTAVFLTALAGFVGAGVDLGMLYTARSQLQSAADSAAMAGANNLVISQGDIAVANYYGAESTSQQFAGQNEILNQMFNSGDPSAFQFTAGLWDKDTGTFTSTGFSANPDDLTGVRVTLNRSVGTNFARIVGISQVNLSASSTAFLGWAGSTPKRGVDLPIAIHDDAYADCTTILRFNSEETESVTWTSFFDWPANTNTIRPYIDCDCHATPALALGDTINLNNGVIATLFQRLLLRFNQEKDPNGTWRVLLPVVHEGSPQNQGEVVGFAYFVITEVRGPGGPDGKQLEGHMECSTTIAEGAATGGPDYGTRASRSTLVQ